MNDLLKQRILRRLETLSDERGFQILDYVEFMESKYAERQTPSNIFARITRRSRIQCGPGRSHQGHQRHHEPDG